MEEKENMKKNEFATYFLVVIAVGVLAYSAVAFFVQPQVSGFGQQPTSALRVVTESSGGETYEQMMARMHPGQSSQNQAGANAQPSGPVASVDYVGYLENGTIFDTSIKDVALKANLTQRQSYSPLTFTLGSGQVVNGLDAGVQAMVVGETKTLKITPDIGFGEYNPQLVTQISIAKLEAMNVTPTVGMRLYTPTGLAGIVLNLTGNNATIDNATIDFNSFLAGKTFYLNVTLLSKT